MDKLKVEEVTHWGIIFEDGTVLCSEHEQDCCENHYLDFTDLTLNDFEDLEFDLSNDNFFRKVENYGIELIPTNGWSVKIPGYGSNNGYYSTKLILKLNNDKTNFHKSFDISECQDITD